MKSMLKVVRFNEGHDMCRLFHCEVDVLYALEACCAVLVKRVWGVIYELWDLYV